MNNKIIECKNITYKVTHSDIEEIILNDISFDINRGEFIIILGKSGSGKTTLFNTIVGLIEPTSGYVFINNHNITIMSDDEKTYWRRYYFGYIFQNYGLFPTLNVYDNIIMSYHMINMYSKHAKRYFNTDAQKEKIDKNFVNEVIQKLKLEDIKNKFPHELSGGQQQRVAISRIFIKKPEIIFADEPTGALDDETSENVMEILKYLNNKGATVVLITHNENLLKYATKIIWISDGKILAIKSLKSELTSPDWASDECLNLINKNIQLFIFVNSYYVVWG